MRRRQIYQAQRLIPTPPTGGVFVSEAAVQPEVTPVITRTPVVALRKKPFVKPCPKCGAPGKGRFFHIKHCKGTLNDNLG